jgi:hypothetical protein
MTVKPTIDNSPSETSRSVGWLKAKTAVLPQSVVGAAQNPQQMQIASLFGSIEYDANYDYKAQRRRVGTGLADSE